MASQKGCYGQPQGVPYKWLAINGTVKSPAKKGAATQRITSGLKEIQRGFTSADARGFDWSNNAIKQTSLFYAMPHAACTCQQKVFLCLHKEIVA